MRDRVWVLGAGGPAGFNVAAAAKAAGYRVVGVEGDPNHLPFAESLCQEVAYDQGIPQRAIDEGELILPQPESLVRRCAAEASIRYHGPSTSVLDLVADKHRSVLAWHDAGLRTTAPILIGSEIPDWLAIAKDKYGPTFWLRARAGAGARGAILVHDLRAAFHWIRLHETAGIAAEFVAEEYLPGRDFCWTAVYHEGERIASFSRERLEWIYPHLAPFSGRTGTPSRSRVVCDDRVLITGARAVTVVDKKPHGVYCVDMRENDLGYPEPTEINAGRWATTSPLYRALGPNLVAVQIRLAHGDQVSPPGDDPYPAGAELLRHIDMGMVVRP